MSLFPQDGYLIDDEIQIYCLESEYCGLSPDFIESQYCMILEAYFDDSENDGYYAIGGHFAPLSVWKKWVPAWHQHLKQKPRLGYFRSFDAIRLIKQFEHFDQDERDKRVIALAETLPKKNFFSVYAYLKKDDLKIFSSDYPILYKNPFYICAFCLTTQLSLDLFVRANPHPTQIDYIFDREGNAGLHFKEVSEFETLVFDRDYFPFQGEFRFKNKEKFLPLQAADMYVSWVRRKISGSATSLASDSILSQVITQDKQIIYHIDRERLECWMKTLPGYLENFPKSLGVEKNS